MMGPAARAARGEIGLSYRQRPLQPAGLRAGCWVSCLGLTP